MSARARGIIVMLTVGLAPVPAQAFLGVGDITFDPTSHAELVRIFTEARTLYHTVSGELATAREIESVLRDANTDRQRLRRGHLSQLMSSLQSVTGLVAHLPQVRALPGASALSGRYEEALSAISSARSFAASLGRSLGRLDGVVPGTHHAEADIARATTVLATLAVDHAEQSARARAGAIDEEQRAARRAADLSTWARSLGGSQW